MEQRFKPSSTSTSGIKNRIRRGDCQGVDQELLTYLGRTHFVEQALYLAAFEVHGRRLTHWHLQQSIVEGKHRLSRVDATHTCNEKDPAEAEQQQIF